MYRINTKRLIPINPKNKIVRKVVLEQAKYSNREINKNNDNKIAMNTIPPLIAILL